MAEIVPSDALFEAAFAEARVSQVHLARYYLRAMEQKKKGKDEPEWVPQDDENEINLEHILPELGTRTATLHRDGIKKLRKNWVYRL
jgi:hypothetical protein